MQRGHFCFALTRFNSSPEVIRLAVMVIIRCPLSLGQIEDTRFDCGIVTCQETVRFWWNRLGPNGCR